MEIFLSNFTIEDLYVYIWNVILINDDSNFQYL